MVGQRASLCCWACGGIDPWIVVLVTGASKNSDCYRSYLLTFGHFIGQLTMYSSSLSSGTLASLSATLPRTEMPASCTVFGSPETSGCHHGRSLPAATSL